MSTMTADLAYDANTLVDPVADDAPSAPTLTRAERVASESDLRDWHAANRRYGAMIRAGVVLDREQETDYLYCLYAVNQHYLCSEGLV